MFESFKMVEVFWKKFIGVAFRFVFPRSIRISASAAISLSYNVFGDFIDIDFS